MVSADARLVELGLELPAPPPSLGSYVPVQLVGEMLYTSGVLPMRDGAVEVRGVVGAGVSVGAGSEAARLCALNILALVREAIGSLDRIDHVVQISGFVRSAPDFHRQPQVLNGASDLFVEVLGERGRHTRLALGISELPRGAVVEISAVIKLKPQD